MTPANRTDDLLARKRLLESHECEAPDFNDRLKELRAWQAARLARTYADLQADPQYRAPVEFFLREVYGPQDFAKRDRDLTRAWRYLKRALPGDAFDALERAIELQVLTTELDHAMIEALAPGPISKQTYEIAYQAVGRRAARLRQIDLVVAIGEDLMRIVRRSWIALTLRAAHAPAHATGLAALQGFLENGFTAFREMRDPQKLLRVVREREMRLMDAMLLVKTDD